LYNEHLGGQKSRTRKVTINLSIDENIINSLRKDAEAKRASLNARINAILTKYINFYQRTEEFEACIIVSRQFALFLEMLDEDKTAEIMKTDGTDAVISYFQHHNIPITLESMIEFTFENLAIASGVCTKLSQHIDDEGFRWLVFDHRYGIKWSRIISEVFSFMLEKTCNMHTTVNLLPNTISLKILKKDI